MSDINDDAHNLIKSTSIVLKRKLLSILEWFGRLGKQWWQLKKKWCLYVWFRLVRIFKMQFLRKNNESIQKLVKDVCCQTDSCDEIQETEHVDALDQLNICDAVTHFDCDDLLDQKRLTDISSAIATVSPEVSFSSTLEQLSTLPDQSALSSQRNTHSSDDENYYPIGISFSGKNKDQVEQICEEVQKELSEKIFFAPWHQHKVAQIYGNPFLRKIYEKASFVIVFLSRDYELSDFCFYEWRVIKQRFMVRPAKQKNDRLLLIKLEDINIETLDLFNDDFYIDVSEMITAKEVADLIIKRWRIVEQLPRT
ncbi:unnamed protein product [Rotaria sordida]|uniref:TIR domain-containing protein n=1 Tax=Rotaria sordida TaxID=392033 RepID=A0A814VG18_9BILA|nr:unnamed protein product [Rotaria sordida]